MSFPNVLDWICHRNPQLDQLKKEIVLNSYKNLLRTDDDATAAAPGCHQERRVIDWKYLPSLSEFADQLDSDDPDHMVTQQTLDSTMANFWTCAVYPLRQQINDGKQMIQVGSLRTKSPSSSHTVEMVAPPNLTQTMRYVYPPEGPTVNGQLLSCSTDGKWMWVTPPSSSSSPCPDAQLASQVETLQGSLTSTMQRMVLLETRILELESQLGSWVAPPPMPLVAMPTINGTQMTVSWTMPPGRATEQVTSYEVKVGNDDPIDVLVPAMSFDFQFIPDHHYTIGVTAVNSLQQTRSPTGYSPTITIPHVAVPTGVVASLDGNQITVSWSHSGGLTQPTEFEVKSNDETLSMVVPWGVTPTASFEGAVGVRYEFVVRALSISGHSVWSNASESILVPQSIPAEELTMSGEMVSGTAVDVFNPDAIVALTTYESPVSPINIGSIVMFELWPGEMPPGNPPPSVYLHEFITSDQPQNSYVWRFNGLPSGAYAITIRRRIGTSYGNLMLVKDIQIL